MANSHVEIHDPFANENAASSDAELSSPTDSMDDTVEFKLLMVYSQRRRPIRVPEPDGPAQMDPPSTQTAENDKQVTEEEKKKKKKKKRRGSGMLRIFSCIKPSVKNEESSESAAEPEFRSLATGDAHLVTDRCLSAEINQEKTDELDQVADVLTEIANEIPFAPSDIETDSKGDVKSNQDDDANVEKVVALLLREAGDKLNQEMKDANIAAEFFRNYSFFERVMKTLLRRMGLMSSEPDHLGPQASAKTQIAVTCEATSRLLTLTSFPQRSLLGYGAQYLQDYFSTWVKDNGGYVEAFHSQDEDEVE